MYEKSKIYKLECDDGYYYIGSTCDTLKRRFSNHKHSRDSSPKNRYFNNIGWDKVRITLIEDFPCENKQQLNTRENTIICENKNNQFCLNYNRVGILNQLGRKEYTRQWNEAHKEEKREKAKIYHKLNKEEINAKHRERYALKKVFTKRQ